MVIGKGSKTEPLSTGMLSALIQKILSKAKSFHGKKVLVIIPDTTRSMKRSLLQQKKLTFS